jgi:hypothetical protein
MDHDRHMDLPGDTVDEVGRNPCSIAAAAARRDRHRIEIVTAVLDGRLSQALGLAFEHFEEFGLDCAVLGVLSLSIGGSEDIALHAGLRDLLGRLPRGADG